MARIEVQQMEAHQGEVDAGPTSKYRGLLGFAENNRFMVFLVTLVLELVILSVFIWAMGTKYHPSGN